MKKSLIILTFTILVSFCALAQTPQSSKEVTLDVKKQISESTIEEREKRVIRNIDEKIAQAKEAGKPTEKLEQRRQRMLEIFERKKEASVNSEKLDKGQPTKLEDFKRKGHEVDSKISKKKGHLEKKRERINKKFLGSNK